MLRKAIIIGVIATTASLVINSRVRVLSKANPTVTYKLGAPIPYLSIKHQPKPEDWSFFLVAFVLDLAVWTTVGGIGLAIVQVRRRNRSLEEGKCIQCGYDLQGLPEPRCPECGAMSDAGNQSIRDSMNR